MDGEWDGGRKGGQLGKVDLGHAGRIEVDVEGVFTLEGREMGEDQERISDRKEAGAGGVDEENEDGQEVEEGIRIFPWEVRERKGGREALRVPSEVKLLEGGPATCKPSMEEKLRVFYDDGKMHF